ncbi:glycosyltransferase [Actinoplanes sp. TBRC 11911]|uniref:glycosyltransferase n=1 Tax=Actinoplanes sp. TBRC 11911 TaxID=2729386 RepID=UPI0028A1F88D|nr:glycosyltransferase [Actinoplanes sp. TBRC 11911]
MRVLIVTSGSTGDVAPYLGIAVRLQSAGHDVTLATHAPFRSLVTGAGVPFRPIPGDMRAVLPQARGQDGRGSGTDPRALLKLMSLARPLIRSMADGIAAVVESVRPDALLLSTLVAPLGYQLAEAYRIKAAGLFPQPLYPTREFGSVLVGGRSFGPWGNLAFGHLVDSLAQTMYTRAIRSLRASLALPDIRLRTLERAQLSLYPTFYGFSRAVVPRPADWPAQLRISGYWWPARPRDWQPPAELVDFLAAGPPPVHIGFGSMAPGHGSRLTAIVMDAVHRTGVRAILQSGWSGLATGPTDDVLSIGDVPHDWLFPQVSAVVHHAGAGTTAAALRAGVPAVPVPVLADQPFWARRVHHLGAAARPIPMPALTGERLADALLDVRDNPHRAARAQALSAQLTAEDATADLLAWLTAT